MTRISITIITLLCLATHLVAQERVPLWPKNKMPHAQEHQIAAMANEARSKDFKPGKNRIAYIEWFQAPAKETHNGGCMILISGGSYESCCDMGLIKLWNETFTRLGFQCVNLVYRTPRPLGLPIYQTAWEDAQRAVRHIRSQAAKRGIDPEKIGVISMSAGSHLAILMAANSQTPAYPAIDKLDTIPCHINWAIVNAPAYGTTDAENGTQAQRQGYGTDVSLSKVFNFDQRTCPMSLHHGGKDIYAPHTSTLVYRQLRKMGIPAELHLYADNGHGAYGLERGIEFMRQMGFITPLEKEVSLEQRFNSDDHLAQVQSSPIWPEGKMPNAQEHQCIPEIEWHIPKQIKTRAIQIIYSGGGYNANDPDGFEVTPARRYLNEKGMTVVTLRYRTPRPKGLSKHTTAWQDLQRAIRLVRKGATERGLDPNRIGIMGSSAGGHLTLMGVTSSMHQSYWPIDETDNIPCNVQWGIGIYPAYALTDGLENYNTTKGNEDSAILAPEFSFDKNTSPMLLIHGDADVWASMNSVKVWEKMLQIGVQCELHTLAKRQHCFQRQASPGTGSYTHLDRIWEFLTAKGLNKENAPAK